MVEAEPVPFGGQLDQRDRGRDPPDQLHVDQASARRWPGRRHCSRTTTSPSRRSTWHQEYLSTFGSRGSSANNHVIAELAGLLVAAARFPGSLKVPAGATKHRLSLERELDLNTFPSGMNREQASDYHGFVLELGILAAVEAEASGHPLDPGHLAPSCPHGRRRSIGLGRLSPRTAPGRRGRGQALVIDDPEANRWSTLLATAATLVGAADWWPHVSRGRHEHLRRIARTASWAGGA